MKSTKLFLTIAAFLIGFSSAFAQDDAAEKKRIEGIVKAFAKEYEGITKASSTEKLLSFVAPNLRSTNVMASVTGRMNVTNADFNDFAGYLDQLRGDKGLKMTYKIKDILDVNVRGNVASVVYTVDYSNKKDSYLLSKGQENVTMTLYKKGDVWKIVHFNFVNIEDEKEHGPCLCELFVASTGNYVAKTIVPGGKSYQTIMNNFEFRKEGKERMIRIEGNIYKWADGGDVSLVSASSSRENASKAVLGNGATPEEAIMIIIENVMYKDNCTDFKVRKKK